MIRALLAIVLLASCTAPPAPPPAPSPPPVAEAPPPPPPPTTVPAKLRAALARVTPREAALVAAPTADANDIALVRQLDSNVRQALADLERDGGRHVTPAQVAKAKTALKDLENHLNEFQANKGDSK